MSHPPPSTPAPRRFLLAKRGTQSSQTPTAPPQFQSTPRFGSSSVPRPTQGRAGRDIEDVEDVADRIADSSPENGAQGGRARKGNVLKDSIEIESDASTASDDDSKTATKAVAEAGRHDSIEPDSIEPFGPSDDSSPFEEREPKRRRVSISPVPDSSFLEEEDQEEEEEEEEELNREQEQGSDVGSNSAFGSPASRQTRRSSSMESLGDARSMHGEGRALQQPTFQAPPRFKPTEMDMLADGLPPAFSPQRRGPKYVPGGMAADLQGWLSEIKGWEGIGQAAEAVARVTVEELRPGRRMYLVQGRVEGEADAAPRRFLLAGEGKLTGLGQRADVGIGSVIAVGQPVWDIELEGETWTVSCDWSVC